MFEIARDLFLFILVTGGLALPAADWARRFDPVERLTVGLVASVSAIALFAFAVYLLRLDPRWHWLLALAAVAGGASTWRRAEPWLRTGEVAAAVVQWLVFTLWCLGCLALVFSYSGGGWAGDWQEHYERALFFLHHWPVGHLFIQAYPLTARPPLGNLATAGFLALTSDRMVPYQIFTLLLNTLVFFPVLLFARAWRPGTRAAALVALALMLNPSIVENATFAWTKLIAAFFTVTGVYFLARDVRTPDPASVRAGAGAFAAAILTHYSAAPWLLAFGPAWLWARRRSWREGGFLRTCGGALALGALPLALWVGWATAVYGWAGTFAANTTVAGLDAIGPAAMGRAFLVKLWDTLVPHPWGPDSLALIAQSNPLTRLRDVFFNLYQVNLPLAFGAAGLLLLLQAGRSARRTRPAWLTTPERTFWLVGVLVVIPLGVAVHGETDRVGLAHICLQPLIAIGLAAAAAQLGRARAGGAARLFWVALAVCWGVDLVLGIGLQFSAEAFALGSGHPPDVDAFAHGLSRAAQSNFGGKLRLAQPFLYDSLGFPDGVKPLFLLGLLILACRQALGNGRRSWRPPPAGATNPTRP